MNSEIDTLPDWVRQEAAKYPFAEINICLKIHDGQMRYLEKTVTEKIQLDNKVG